MLIGTKIVHYWTRSLLNSFISCGQPCDGTATVGARRVLDGDAAAVGCYLALREGRRLVAELKGAFR